MMSARNFTLAGSDVIGSWLIDSHGWVFHQLGWLNSRTTAVILLLTPFLRRLILNRRDGEVGPINAGGAPPTEPATAPAT